MKIIRGVPIVSEKAFTQLVYDAARRLGWLCYHVFDARRSAPGFPDLTMTKDGRLVFAELKTERGRLSPAQETWIATLRAVEGVEVYVWRPSMFAEIERTLSHGGDIVSEPVYWSWSDPTPRMPVGEKVGIALAFYRDTFGRDPVQILLHPQDLAEARGDARLASAGVALVENGHVARHMYMFEHPEEGK